MTREKLTVCFDLDGTLTDPVEGITRCIAHALERMNAPAPSLPELACCVGPPLRATFAGLLGPNNGPAQIEQAVAHYRERFHAVGLYENTLYPGVKEMLGTLRDAGLRLYVATAKPHPSARLVLEHFGLSAYFASVYGSEFDGRFDDKGDLLEHLLTQENVAPERALMIGDRSHDVIAALRNGIRPLGVTYGYGSAAELNGAGAAELCATPEQVTAAVLAWAAPLDFAPRNAI